LIGAGPFGSRHRCRTDPVLRTACRRCCRDDRFVRREPAADRRSAPGALNNDVLTFLNTTIARCGRLRIRRSRAIDIREPGLAAPGSPVRSRSSHQPRLRLSGAATAAGAATREPWSPDLLRTRSSA
jgi:hypothetical protein